jgi:hypothetical protein
MSKYCCEAKIYVNSEEAVKPAKSKDILDLKCTVLHWKLFLNWFIAPLSTAVVDKRPHTDPCAPLAICFQIANSCTRCHCKRALIAWGTGEFF